jgi:AraC family ethanolamine operon transcriptional activator
MWRFTWLEPNPEGFPLGHRETLAARFCGKVQFDDFDAIAGVNPLWDERYEQIGRGRPRVRLAVATTGRLQLAYASRAPGLRIRGAAASGVSSIAVPLDVPLLHVQGAAWDPGYLGYAPQDVEYEIFGAAPHRILALAVSHERLQAAAREHLGEPLPELRSGTCVKVRSVEARASLVRTWSGWIARGVRDPALLLDPDTANRMEEDVLAAVLDGVVLDLAPRPARPRRELALRAESFIRDTLGQPVPLGEICAAVHASTRAVHASFQEVFGIPPKAYQKALRLSAVRADLRRARPGTTVSEVAARWGFFQFGYFAVDYRKMFGESPRDTLRLARPAWSGHREPVGNGVRVA